MEQKGYILEIVADLLKEPKHIRALSNDLNTNAMNISRSMKILTRENVADYKQNGKNKTFFLKKTMEARNYIFMSEKHKLNKALKKYPELRRMSESMNNDERIKLAILFGSFAKNTANHDSDIDIYIETESAKIKKDIENINSRLSVKIGKYDKKNLLIKEIEKNHIIIKGVELFYEKNRFFK